MMPIFQDENCVNDKESLIKNHSDECNEIEKIANIQEDKVNDDKYDGHARSDKISDGDTNDSCHAIKPEKKRWYILTVFILMACIQGYIWNTFGSIAESAELAFEWHSSMIAIIGNWGGLASLVGIIPFTWAMDQKGMKPCILVSVGLMVIGGGLKCISSSPPTATWLINIGQILHNFGSPVILSGPPVISSLWFPVHQRTTATALMSGLGGAGLSFSYIVGPFLVPDVENKTVCLNRSSMYSIDYNISNCAEQQHTMKKAIMMYMYIEFAIVGALFLIIILYFPAKPSRAPSITSTLSRSDFKKGIIDLMKMPMFWVITMIYSIGTGVLSGWYTVLDLIFLPLGVSQKATGLIGFWSIAAGQILVVPIGFLADVFAKRMKLFLTVLTIIACVACLVMALSCSQIIPFNIVILYVCTITASVCVGCGNPLQYELVSEMTYPISEAISNNVMQAFYYIVQLIFVVLFMVPNIGTAWVNWTYMGSMAVCIPLCLMIKEDYRRFDIDTEPERQRRKIPDPIEINV